MKKKLFSSALVSSFLFGGVASANLAEEVYKNRGVECKTYECFYDLASKGKDVYGVISVVEDSAKGTITQSYKINFFDTKKNNLFGEGKLMSKYFFSAGLADVDIKIKDFTLDVSNMSSFVGAYEALEKKQESLTVPQSLKSRDYSLLSEFYKGMEGIVGHREKELFIVNKIKGLSIEQESKIIENVQWLKHLANTNKEWEGLQFSCYMSSLENFLPVADIQKVLGEDGVEALRENIPNSGVIKRCYNPEQDPFIGEGGLNISFGTTVNATKTKGHINMIKTSNIAESKPMPVVTEVQTEAKPKTTTTRYAPRNRTSYFVYKNGRSIRTFNYRYFQNKMK